MNSQIAWERRIRLDDNTWLQLQKLLPHFPRGRPSKKTRNFIEAVLFRIRTGTPWRDLPPDFGPWKSVYNRFNRWNKKEFFFRDVWQDKRFNYSGRSVPIDR